MGTGPRSAVAGMVASAIIAMVYAPTLGFPFDFVDDGILVYPSGASTPTALASQVFRKAASEFSSSGPFRPIAWLHWDLAAEVFGNHAVGHRLARLIWAWLAAGCLIWFFREMGVAGWPALLAAALAMWNKYRGEIWLGLGLTEAFAMPYALVALVAAKRAAGRASWNRWDVAALICTVLALGVKNTFAAIIPAQVFLRLVGGGVPLRTALRQNFGPAALLAATALLPIGQLLWMHYDSSPRTYHLRALDPLFLFTYLKGLRGAIDSEWMAPALALSMLLLLPTKGKGVGSLFPGGPATANGQAATSPGRPEKDSRPLLILTTAALLLLFGFLVYWPVQSVAGRYMIPAAWGLDLLIALTLDKLLRTPAAIWRNVALAMFVAGLGVSAVANLARQEAIGQRSGMLWEALSFLEEHASAGDTVVFVGKPLDRAQADDLVEGEGMHFRWHLQKRARMPLNVAIVSDEKEATPAHGDWLLAGAGDQPNSDWLLCGTFQTCPTLWKKSSACRLWQRTAASLILTRGNEP